MDMLLNLDEQALLFQVFHNLCTRIEAGKAFIRAAVFVDDCGFIQYVDFLEAVALAHFKVVGIMRRRHLDQPGAEFLVHEIVGKHGYLPVHERQDDLFPNEVRIAFVFRVHCNSGVAEHGLGPRCCNHDRVS